jgi:hypothetical protein
MGHGELLYCERCGKEVYPGSAPCKNCGLGAPWDISKELSTGELLISVLMVLRSAAGYYIGRMCMDLVEFYPNYIEEPYSRESGYYPTEEAAQAELKGGFSVRDCVENNHAYANGLLSLTAK